MEEFRVPLPIIEVKEEQSDVIDLESSVKTPEEIASEWDHKIRLELNKHVPPIDPGAFFKCMEWYKRELKEISGGFADNDTLKRAMMRHLKFFEFIQKTQHLDVNTYLEIMEDLLTFYANIIINDLMEKKNTVKKREMKRISASESRRLKSLLSRCLLEKQDRMAHVLMRIDSYPDVQACRDVLNNLFGHFLSKLYHSPTDLNYIRCYIICQKWKQNRKPNEWEMLEKFVQDIFKRNPNSIDKNQLLRNILLEVQPRITGRLETSNYLYDKVKMMSSEYFKIVKTQQTGEVFEIDDTTERFPIWGDSEDLQQNERYKKWVQDLEVEVKNFIDDVSICVKTEPDECLFVATNGPIRLPTPIIDPPRVPSRLRHGSIIDIASEPIQEAIATKTTSKDNILEIKKPPDVRTCHIDLSDIAKTLSQVTNSDNAVNNVITKQTDPPIVNLIPDNQPIAVDKQPAPVENPPATVESQHVTVENQQVTDDSQRVTIENQQVTVENLPVTFGNQPLPVETHSTPLENQPMPIQSQPVAVDDQPMLVDKEPTSVDTQPVPVDNPPMQVDNQPVLVDKEPASIIDNRLTSIDNQTLPVDNQPAPTHIQPCSVEIQPKVVDNHPTVEIEPMAVDNPPLNQLTTVDNQRENAMDIEQCATVDNRNAASVQCDKPTEMTIDVVKEVLVENSLPAVSLPPVSVDSHPVETSQPSKLMTEPPVDSSKALNVTPTIPSSKSTAPEKKVAAGDKKVDSIAAAVDKAPVTVDKVSKPVEVPLEQPKTRRSQKIIDDSFDRFLNGTLSKELSVKPSDRPVPTKSVDKNQPAEADAQLNPANIKIRRSSWLMEHQISSTSTTLDSEVADSSKSTVEVPAAAVVDKNQPEQPTVDDDDDNGSQDDNMEIDEDCQFGSTPREESTVSNQLKDNDQPEKVSVCTATQTDVDIQKPVNEFRNANNMGNLGVLTPPSEHQAEIVEHNTMMLMDNKDEGGSSNVPSKNKKKSVAEHRVDDSDGESFEREVDGLLTGPVSRSHGELINPDADFDLFGNDKNEEITVTNNGNNREKMHLNDSDSTSEIESPPFDPINDFTLPDNNNGKKGEVREKIGLILRLTKNGQKAVIKRKKEKSKSSGRKGRKKENKGRKGKEKHRVQFETPIEEEQPPPKSPKRKSMQISVQPTEGPPERDDPPIPPLPPQPLKGILKRSKRPRNPSLTLKFPKQLINARSLEENSVHYEDARLHSEVKVLLPTLNSRRPQKQMIRVDYTTDEDERASLSRWKPLPNQTTVADDSKGMSQLADPNLYPSDSEQSLRREGSVGAFEPDDSVLNLTVASPPNDEVPYYPTMDVAYSPTFAENDPENDLLNINEVGVGNFVENDDENDDLDVVNDTSFDNIVVDVVNEASLVTKNDLKRGYNDLDCRYDSCKSLLENFDEFKTEPAVVPDLPDAKIGKSENIENDGTMTRLPLKKRKTFTLDKAEEEYLDRIIKEAAQKESEEEYFEKLIKEASSPKKEISYPAETMISIAEVQEQEKNPRPFKTAAERKEIPPVDFNTAGQPRIVTEQYNNHTYNNPTINYHMNTPFAQPLAFNCAYVPNVYFSLLPLNSTTTFTTNDAAGSPTTQQFVATGAGRKAKQKNPSPAPEEVPVKRRRGRPKKVVPG